MSSNITDIEAALVEPVACCLHGIDKSNIKPGDNVLVIGGGPIGLIMLQLAFIKGASNIILSELDNFRRNFAEKFNVDLLVDPSKGNLKNLIPKDLEPHVVIECVGNPKTQEAALKVVKTRPIHLYNSFLDLPFYRSFIL